MLDEITGVSGIEAQPQEQRFLHSRYRANLAWLAGHRISAACEGLFTVLD